MLHHNVYVYSLGYLKQIAGPRTVPVELGSRYTDDNWAQKLMTLSEFIDTHIVTIVSIKHSTVFTCSYLSFLGYKCKQ